MIEFSRFKADDEFGRQSALDRLGVVDTPPEHEFDDIVALVKTVFGAEYAAVNLIDHDRQWTKAAAGINLTTCRREDAFCSRTILGLDPVAVSDARDDARFRDSNLVTGAAQIRSYLGVPLTTPDGYNIGALCVFGTVPRIYTPAEAAVLQNFAKVVMSQIELRQAARQDVLTGALTRRAFIDRVDELIASRDVMPGTLIMLDIDHFKQVNDTWGHPAGDVVLRTVTDTIQQSLRRADLLGRLGGEEFAILAPGTDEHSTLALAGRLRARLSGCHIAEIGGNTVTISMGIAAWQPGESRDSWFARADAALYAAKRGGRDRAEAAIPFNAPDTAPAPAADRQGSPLDTAPAPVHR